MVVIYGFVIVFVLSFGVTFLPNLVNDDMASTISSGASLFHSARWGRLASLCHVEWRRINHVRGIAIGVLAWVACASRALVLSSP